MFDSCETDNSSVVDIRLYYIAQLFTCYTVYMPSPTKKAAKAISDKALSRASQKSKYKSPLKSRSSPFKVMEPSTQVSVEKQVSITGTFFNYRPCFTPTL